MTLAAALLAALLGAWLHTSAGLPGLVALVLAVIVWVPAYMAVCWRWPFAACRRCAGEGKLREPFSRRSWRTCPRCKGTSKQLRFGRRFLNVSSTTARNATR